MNDVIPAIYYNLFRFECTYQH